MGAGNATKVNPMAREWWSHATHGSDSTHQVDNTGWTRALFTIAIAILYLYLISLELAIVTFFFQACYLLRCSFPVVFAV